MAQTPVGPGTLLAGRFSLDDLLDESSGARFWRATDRTLARSVAVHVLAESDPRAGALLVAARTSALVTDGHLLRVLDAAAEDGNVYVVNEWGSGVSLDRLLGEGPLSPRRAAWVVKEVAEAIVTAHRHGVAHGRLLPENVMISEAGSVKLVGFVIDSVLRSGGEHRRVTGGPLMTALESDVVNLAGLLYAALVGRWPGTEGSTIPVAPVEHGRPLRPRRVRAGVPRPLDAICERVLNAGSHPQMLPLETAHEVFAALSDFVGDPGAAAPLGAQVGSEATTVLHRADLPGTVPDTLGGGDTSDLPAAGAFPAPGAAMSADEFARHGHPERRDRVGADPEATQAGVPMFGAEGTGVGWLPADDERTRRTPPPPPPDPPERPLFADEHPPAAGGWRTAPSSYDDTGSFTGGQRSTGAGNGSVPSVWGPDAQPPPEPHPPGDREVPGRTWLRLAVVLASLVVLVVAVLVAVNLDRGGGAGTARTPSPGASSSPATQAGARIPIAAVSDFDPEADPPEENAQLAKLAVDGKPGTAWKTVTYRGNPQLGGLKSGVGLRVDLGEPVQVGSVRLTLQGSPTSVQILAAPGADAAPTSTGKLRTVATADRAGTDVDLPFKQPVTTRWLVVWLTSLPPAPGGFQGRIAEISVRS